MFGAYSDYPEDNDVLIRLYTEKGEEMIRYAMHFVKNQDTAIDLSLIHISDPITWVDSTAEAAFIFTGNGSYNAYACDLAGNAVSYTHLLYCFLR